jgi:enoyl-[acyl-carrier protein] reductase/trans-2-enoyl-CoA reductase (NAD+)
MFRDRLYNGKSDVLVDDTNRIRLDDWEMDQDVQNEVMKAWATITTENLNQTTNFKEYQNEFLKLFGFGIEGVNYDEDIDLVDPFTSS